VGKKKLGGDPDFLSNVVLFPFSNFLHEMGRVEFSHFGYHQVALTWDLNRLEAVVLSRTREQGDSTTFDVRRCFQCSRGKS
jgi:hypothetical protein